MIRMPQADYRRMVAFLLVGGASAIATIALRAVLTRIVAFEIAVAVSHVFGLTMAFSLNRLFVFRTYEGGLIPAYLRFFLVNLLSLAIATAVSSFMFRVVFQKIEVGPYADYIAHFIGLGSAAIPSYFAHTNFSFKNKPIDT